MKKDIIHPDTFIAAGCEAEIYTYDKKTVLKLYYKKIPINQIEKVYTKYLLLNKITEICTLISRGIDPTTQRHYHLLERIDGISIKEISDKGSLQLNVAIKIVAKTIEILIKIHQNGTVHGDIHGENIIINNTGVVTLIDLSSEEKSKHDDIVDICKFFHEIMYNNNSLTKEIKDIFPKKRDAILRRYKNMEQLYIKVIRFIK